MKFNFRQGLLHAPLVSGHPAFMTYNSGTGRITISIGIDFVQATAAYGVYNYLIEERENAVDKWGPFDWNPLWGATPIGNYTLYLYWDINRATGLMSHGFSPRAPVFNLVEPSTPAVDQHWFDLNTSIMMVWDGSFWVKKIRVFAGSFTTGTQTIAENDLGTQVGLTFGGSQETWPDHGYILFGADMRGIRYNDTNFVTTSTQINTNHGSFSSPIRLELMNSTVLASEPIPAFYAVSNSGAGTVGLANGTDLNKRPIGLTIGSAITGDPIDIVTHGILFNDQWAWNVSTGEKDLYCGSTGEIVQGAVNFTNGVARIGTILGPQTILVDIDLYALGIAGPAGPSGTGSPTFVVDLAGSSINMDRGLFSNWFATVIQYSPEATWESYPNKLSLNAVGVWKIGVQVKAIPDSGTWPVSGLGGNVYGTYVAGTLAGMDTSQYGGYDANSLSISAQSPVWYDEFIVNVLSSDMPGKLTEIATFVEAYSGGLATYRAIVTATRMIGTIPA